VGGINIDACRIGDGTDRTPGGNPSRVNFEAGWGMGRSTERATGGRWPSNVILSDDAEVQAAFEAFGEKTSGSRAAGVYGAGGSDLVYGARGEAGMPGLNGSTGSAARFFYTSKADKADRADSKHPTVKPLDLMVWLTKLVCPPGGTVLDPFAGSGVTAEACMLNGFDCILAEQNPEYCRDIRHRIRRWSGEDCPLFADVAD